MVASLQQERMRSGPQTSWQGLPRDKRVRLSYLVISVYITVVLHQNLQAVSVAVLGSSMDGSESSLGKGR